MGLDAVELILRAEELYSTTFTDDEAAQVRTVGDFYQLICSRLNLTPLTNPQNPPTLPKISEVESLGFLRRRYTHLPPPPEVLPWHPQSVWNTLVAIFVDQLCLKPDKILPDARILDDLGVA
jgi:hypothetical protein